MMNFRNMPKVELHLHFDGSLNIEDIKNRYNLTDNDIKEKMVADKKCKDLNDYLTKFDYPISIMQKKIELELDIISLLKSLKSQNVIYAEIRFAPQFHTKEWLSQDEVVNIVIEAMKKVDIKSNLILCIMRGKDNEKENYETIEVAKKYLGKGVCALDLAGAEAIFKTSEYEEIFKYANKLNIPYTIHAGEADGVESIRSAIKFGARRIGHGVRAIESDELVKEIAAKEITLEVCPTSNIQTCICTNYSTHPIYELYKNNVKVTINTDNMTVSNTSLENEYTKISENGDVSFEDIVKMNLNSIDAAFITKEEKGKLRQMFLEEIESEDRKLLR